MTGTSGNIAEWQRYEAFGNSNLQSSLTRYGYTGRERDEQTGLNYYRARWYDSQQGRFISQDPIGFEGGSNFYNYVDDTPLNLKDSLGLFPDNPYDIIPESGWTALGHIGNFAAGFGDTVTMGGTRWIRQKMGTDNVVDPCSWAYFAGDVTGTILPMFIGGAGAAKGALAAGGRSGSLFARLGRGGSRFFADGRKFSTVSRQYWNRVTGFGPANGRHLHHWMFPQRASQIPQAIRNGRWNMMELPGRLNSWMGYSQTGRAVEWGIRAAVPGSLIGGGVAGANWGMEKSEWKDECGCN